MAKNPTYYECQKCGAQHSTWQGQCTDCGNWNTLEAIEPSVTGPTSSAPSAVNSSIPSGSGSSSVRSYKIKDIKFKENERTKIGIEEFDRVLGGGFIKGQTVLISGEPGIGKSTLLLQVANSFKLPVYYVCGEESPYQVKQRYTRLSLTKSDLELIENGFVETIESYVSRKNPGLIIFDSINSGFSSKYKSSQGSISQIKQVSQTLVTFAKMHGFPLVLVGQINKEGEIAGPKTLEHMVDTVLTMEGDNNHAFRVLRATKNRFGSINEVGLFSMESNGMIEVTNPSKFLLQGKVDKASGSVISVVSEGSRTFAVEVQALTNKTSFGYPKRTSNGFSLNRLQLLAAVVSKRTKFSLLNDDIYLNVASGIKLIEPAADLAVCMSLISAVSNKPISSTTAFFAEVGLNGELRPVNMPEQRIKEAKKMGIKNVITPETHKTLNDVVRTVLG